MPWPVSTSIGVATPAEQVTRRTAVVRLGVGGGLGLALAWRGFAASAQDGTPEVTEMELPPVVARFVAAMEAADADQLAASYAPDGVLEEVGFAATYTGRDAIRENEAVFLAAFTDVTIEVPTAFGSGDWGAVEFSFTGTYAGALPGMPAGTGQTVAFRGSSILHVGSEGILRHNQYFDAYGILAQFGALPAPEGAGGETSPDATPPA